MCCFSSCPSCDLAASCCPATVAALPEERRALVGGFIRALAKVYLDLNFVYLEINPIVVTDGRVYALDMAAKIDETASFVCGKKWGALEFPAPFGRAPYPEEAYIKELDSKTGASLKLTVLNRKGVCVCVCVSVCVCV